MGRMDLQARRQFLLVRMAVPEGTTFAELLDALPDACSERTLRADLQALSEQFPHRLTKTHQGRAHVYHFQGDPPRLLPSPLGHLEEDQITALIAARGILRLPDPATPTNEQPAQAYRGVLSQAIDRLLHDIGLADEASRLAPDDLSVSRFGIADEDPATFPMVLDALRTGESLRAQYPDHTTGILRPVHLRPIRLVSIGGEWFLFHWTPDVATPPGRIKQYRLSRLTEVTRAATDPPGCPASGLRSQVTAILADAFRATGSLHAKDRIRVCLAGKPEALKFVERRRWGADQHLDLGPHADLPPGWWRLDFVTAGLLDCSHWILGFGPSVLVESPAVLKERIIAQSIMVINAYKAVHPAI